MSRITIVNWDPNCFNSLVLEKSTKELILALVTNHIEAERAAGEIPIYGSRKNGNGLIILLDG